MIIFKLRVKGLTKYLFSYKIDYNMKKNAFSLIEILVVVAIMMITMSFGLANFFNLQDRQEVENTAKEIIVYLRGIQNYAKTGNRGGGNCGRVTNAEIAAGNLPLKGWMTKFETQKINSYSMCGECRVLGPTSICEYGIPNVFSLPANVFLVTDRTSMGGGGGGGGRPRSGGSLTRPDNGIFFPSLFSDFNSGIKYVIVHNNKYYYRFNIDRGTITNGCLCVYSGTSTVPSEICSGAGGC